MTSNMSALLDIAHAHAAAEAVDDIDTVMETLDDDPTYELQPLGVAFRGRDAAKFYYDYFFGTVKDLISGYDLRGEWANDVGLAQEYVIHFRLPDGSEESHAVFSILVFGEEKLSGERLYGSERLFELLFGPALELTRPVGPGGPS
jgi:hypothetical protein